MASDDSPAGSILIIDDDRFFTDSLRSALEWSGMHVGGVSSDLMDASALARAIRPRVVLIDERLDDVGGRFEATLRHTRPDTVILSVASSRPSSAPNGDSDARRVRVARDDSVNDLIRAVRGALARARVSGPSPSELQRNPSPQATSRTEENLTDREWDVLSLLADGLSSKLIAERLGIGVNTVNTHVQNVLVKLGVHTRLAAAAFAIDRGLLDSRKARVRRTQTPESP